MWNLYKNSQMFKSHFIRVIVCSVASISFPVCFSVRSEPASICDRLKLNHLCIQHINSTSVWGISHRVRFCLYVWILHVRWISLRVVVSEYRIYAKWFRATRLWWDEVSHLDLSVDYIADKALIYLMKIFTHLYLGSGVCKFLFGFTWSIEWLEMDILN